jgi:uncharacterized membrane protein YphA (DoxX/SURF4 family)
MDVFACAYCGTQQRVERKGGTIALRRLAEAVTAVQRGTDRTAAELAIARLDRNLAGLAAEQEEDSKNIEKGVKAIVQVGVVGGVIAVISGSQTWLVAVPVAVVALFVLGAAAATNRRSQRRRQIDRIQEQIRAERSVIEAI